MADLPIRSDSADGRLFELRRYQAVPGRRDALIDMFETVFMDAYLAAGVEILGVFKDRDDPDVWIWIRAFPGAVERAQRLRRFYDGPVWAAGRSACNALIRSSDDAWLLRLTSGRMPRTGDGAQSPDESRGELGLALTPISDPPPAGHALARFHKDPSPNAYPRQRVRQEGVDVVLGRGLAAADASGLHRLVPTDRSLIR